MNTSNRVKEIQNVRTQLLPFGEVRRGSSFNAYNCMKAYSFNGERYGYYGYDASGERTYKYGLDRIDITTNQGDVYVTETYWEANEMMFYPNGYININQDGYYTKHYYAEAARIASKIGGGFNEDLCTNLADTAYLNDNKEEQYEVMLAELAHVVAPTEEIIIPDTAILGEFCVLLDSSGMEDGLFFYHGDHLSSIAMVSDVHAEIVQAILYLPFGEPLSEYNVYWMLDTIPRILYNGKELDEESGMYYYSARYYAPPTFISRDPLFEKYFWSSPYAYCNNNPMKLIDPTGMDWEDTEGNAVKDHSKIKVYIFYDPRGKGEGFAAQSKAMAAKYEELYGKGSVAMSNVRTEDEFAKDWGDMASPDIKIVNINHHGSNQAIHLNSGTGEYITATGNGATNSSGTSATNVQDLPTPKGNISNAQLNLNTCSSNNRNQKNYPLKGSKLTLMQAFHQTFSFNLVRGAPTGVNYSRITKFPTPQFGNWDYMGNVPEHLQPIQPSMFGGFK